ncbi:MAG: hypothetical protein A2086_09490 [Spirochaetes bacterium GWD1_27_9]|nr:MAG: hypothetical protein A2Z98_06050 [Spirochaetes bacterium GWB1_27_13]OHD29728.1 MAG: hypothetical protein A2086_09490 [Spirochaetes bacterium GWD1_27_9]
MKILFVYPKFKKYLETNPKILEAINFPLYAGFKTTPSLGIPILAALTPDEHEIHFADGNLEEIPYDTHFDLVCINCFTPQARAAYEVGDKFKERGVLTVMGGIHPTNMPEDAKMHCDAVAIGDGETIWTQILEDAKLGKLKPFYKAEVPFNMENYVLPRRDLYKNKNGYDWKPLLIQCIRGCDYRCAYCAIPSAHGGCFRFRPIKNVMNEIEQNLDLEGLFIAEDQFLIPEERIEKYAFEFFNALKSLGYKKKIFLNCSTLLNPNPKLLNLVREAGVESVYLVMGFDPISVNAVSFNKPQTAERNIKMLRDAGIDIFASVGVGLDVDNADIFKRHIDFLERNNIKHVEFWILTPFPGSPTWNDFKKKGRILTENFDFYNGAHTVFKPKKMSVEQLDEGFLYLWKEFFTRNPLKPEDAAKYYNMTDEYLMAHGLKKV